MGLMNLLIAKMSDTFANINEQGERRWCFERAQLIHVFKDSKEPIPPPFNLLWNLFVSIPQQARRHFRKRVLGEQLLSEAGFKFLPDIRALGLYEQRASDARYASLKKRDSLQAESGESKIESLKEQIVTMQRTMRTYFE